MAIIGLLSDTHLILRGKVVTIMWSLNDTHLYYEGKWWH